MTLQAVCKTCRKPKAPYTCGLCNEASCKSCAQFLTENSFSFLKKIPTELSHSIYCSSCFDEKVSGPLAVYEDTMTKCKEIIVFMKSQSKATFFLKRKAPPYHVENCEDKEEVLLRMSFFAVQDNYNTLIDVEMKSSKIIVGSHKKAMWAGSGIPISIDPKIIQDDFWHAP